MARRLDRPGAVPLAAWSDPPFLYLRAANLILKGAMKLYQARLLPRSMLWSAAAAARTLSEKGQLARERRDPRRARASGRRLP